MTDPSESPAMDPGSEILTRNWATGCTMNNAVAIDPQMANVFPGLLDGASTTSRIPAHPTPTTFAAMGSHGSHKMGTSGVKICAMADGSTVAPVMATKAANLDRIGAVVRVRRNRETKRNLDGLRVLLVLLLDVFRGDDDDDDDDDDDVIESSSVSCPVCRRREEEDEEEEE